MKVLIKVATVICAVGSFTPAPALALNAVSSGSVSNNYLFIENAIDSEYFITPSALDPRFSGSIIIRTCGLIIPRLTGLFGGSVVIAAASVHQLDLLPGKALIKTVFIMRRWDLSQVLLVAPTDSLP